MVGTKAYQPMAPGEKARTGQGWMPENDSRPLTEPAPSDRSSSSAVRGEAVGPDRDLEPARLGAKIGGGIAENPRPVRPRLRDHDEGVSAGRIGRKRDPRDHGQGPRLVGRNALEVPAFEEIPLLAGAVIGARRPERPETAHSAVSRPERAARPGGRERRVDHPGRSDRVVPAVAERLGAGDGPAEMLDHPRVRVRRGDVDGLDRVAPDDFEIWTSKLLAENARSTDRRPSEPAASSQLWNGTSKAQSRRASGPPLKSRRTEVARSVPLEGWRRARARTASGSRPTIVRAALIG